MRQARRILRSPLLPVCLGALILLAPVYLRGKALFWGTPLMQFVPWWSYAWESLLAGHLPLWNPLLGMGAPLLANYQSGLLYPPNWAYLLLWALGGDRLMAWGLAPLGALHLIWAGAGMVWLARRLGLKPFSQAVCGLAFGLSGYLVSRLGFVSIQSTVAWLPWILALLTPIPGGGKKRQADFFRLTGCLAMCLLAGHAQTAWYTLLLAGLWSAFWSLQPRSELVSDRPRPGVLRVGRAWLWLGLALALAAGIGAAQLLPTAEYLAQSQRASSVAFDYALNYSFWPWHLLTFVAPGIFGSPVSGDYWGYGFFWEDAVYLGLLPFVLACSALLRTLKPGREVPERRRLAWLLAGLCGVALALSLGKNTPLFPWLYRHVPTFDMFQAPARWMIWAEFALALLAGMGAEQWRRPRGWSLYWTRLGTMGALAIAVGAGLAWAYLGTISPTFLRAAFILSLLGVGAGLLTLAAPPGEGAGGGVILAEAKEAPLERPRRSLRQRLFQFVPPPQPSGSPERPFRPGLWQAAVLGLITLDLLAAGWGLNPGADLEVYAPAPNQSRVSALVGEGRIFIPAADEEWLKYDRFLRFDTFDPDEAWVNLRAVMLPNTSLLDRIATSGNYDPLVPGRFSDWMKLLEQAAPGDRQEMLRLMDVGLILSRSPAAPYEVALQDFEGQRLRLVACLERVEGAPEGRRLILEGGLDFATGGFVEGAGAPAAQSCEPGSAAEPAPGSILAVSDVQSAGPNEAEYRVVTRQPAWLVVSELWYPGWKAWVDGEPAEIYRANYLFRAVHLSPGEHTIRMAYVPLSFYAGLATSLVSLAVLLLARKNRQGILHHGDTETRRISFM